MDAVTGARARERLIELRRAPLGPAVTAVGCGGRAALVPLTWGGGGDDAGPGSGSDEEADTSTAHPTHDRDHQRRYLEAIAWVSCGCTALGVGIGLIAASSFVTGGPDRSSSNVTAAGSTPIRGDAHTSSSSGGLGLPCSALAGVAVGALWWRSVHNAGRVLVEACELAALRAGELRQARREARRSSHHALTLIAPWAVAGGARARTPSLPHHHSSVSRRRSSAGAMDRDATTNLPRLDFLEPEVLNGPVLVLLVSRTVVSAEELEEVFEAATGLSDVECLNPLAPVPPATNQHQAPPGNDSGMGIRFASQVERTPSPQSAAGACDDDSFTSPCKGPEQGASAAPHGGGGSGGGEFSSPPDQHVRAPSSFANDSAPLDSLFRTPPRPPPPPSAGGAAQAPQDRGSHLSIVSADDTSLCLTSDGRRQGTANVERVLWTPVQWAPTDGSVRFTAANAHALVLLCPRLVCCVFASGVSVDPGAAHCLTGHGIVIAQGAGAMGVHRAAAVLPSEGLVQATVRKASVTSDGEGNADASAYLDSPLVWYRHGELHLLPQLSPVVTTAAGENGATTSALTATSFAGAVEFS